MVVGARSKMPAGFLHFRVDLRLEVKWASQRQLRLLLVPHLCSQICIRICDSVGLYVSQKGEAACLFPYSLFLFEMKP